MNTGRYSLKQLLNNNEIEQIIIPEIQRDYVWKEGNVTGLINSIRTNYEKKEKISLTIKHNNQEIDAGMAEYLQKEYLRLRYNTQIGFIYAYHDAEYAGKFFLIDGQQRLTTLYLLLLAVYKKAKKEKDFRTLYFVNNQLKLDYKVREVSHDFMHDFVEHVLSEDSPFTASPFYYGEIYRKDTTTNSLWKNYNVIESRLNDIANIEDFIDYIENYIEFNYFDTNLSEQGELLYLYMNSRGENLSYQEIIKSTIIARTKDKLSASKKWEDWQNFFWQSKEDNPNADQGFQAFLKWAAIIQICTTKDEKLKLKTPSLKSDGKSAQSIAEIKEDYIRVEKDDKNEQQERWLKEFYSTNEQFDIDWLESIFGALESLKKSKLLTAPYFREKWLSKITYTIDYVTICGILYYLQQYPKATEEDINRLGMYLMNICYYETNSKGPDSTVIVALEHIQQLLDNGCTDIIELQSLNKLSPRMVSESDKEKFLCYALPQRKEWEAVFWEITKNIKLSEFLDGDCMPFFDLTSKENGVYDLNVFVKYKELFVEKILFHRSEDNLRRDLLKEGDVSLQDGNNNWRLHENMERWSIIRNEENNKTDWHRILKDKNKIIKSFLVADISDSSVNKKDWREPFILKQSVLTYMSQKKFLWTDENHYILLKGTNVDEYHAREIQIHLLHEKIAKSWVYKFDTCVLEFDFIEKNVVLKNKDDKFLFADIEYTWDGEGGNWYLSIGCRVDDDEILAKRNLFLDIHNEYVWETENENPFEKRKCIEPFYSDNEGKSIMENVDAAYSIIKELFKL